jgi:hypothetical protein
MQIFYRQQFSGEIELAIPTVRFGGRESSLPTHRLQNL